MHFDLKPKINEEGIVTVAVSDKELRLFPLLLDHVEKNKIGEREGGLLLSFPSKERGGTPVIDILTVLKLSIPSTLCEQRLVKSTFGKKNLYGSFPSNSCPIDVLNTFSSDYDSMTYQAANGGEQQASVYSKIYEECGAEGIVSYFFKIAENFSCKRVSRHADPLLVFDFDTYQYELKEKAKKLKLIYEEQIATLISMEKRKVKGNVNKPINGRCSCPDCFYSSSDTDEDVVNVANLEGKKKLNKDRKKSTYFVKGPGAPPLNAGGILTDEQFKITTNFSLCKTNSMLDALPEKYLGVHVPHYNIGGCNSYFAAHQEDNGAYELNFLIAGGWKIWVIINESFSMKIEDAFSKSRLHNAHSSCRCLLLHNFFLPTIEFLKEYQIPYNIVVQKPGDLLLLYPDTVHWGFNTSINVSGSCNVGTIGWLRRAVSKRKRCSCMSMEQVHLPLDLLSAIFAEDLLPTLFEEGGNAFSDEDENEPTEDVAPGSKVAATRYSFRCPSKKCDASYSFHKKRLVNHIVKMHSDSKEELLKKVENLYSSRKRNDSLYKHMCEPCGRTYCGSRTLLERHLKNASKPGNGSLESVRKHALALSLFQNAMVGRRRHRNKKVI